MDPIQLETAQVTKLIQQRRFAEAQEHLNASIARSPNDARAHHLLGLVQAMQGFHASAEPFLRKAYELDGTSALYGRNLGLCLQQQNKLDEALAVAKRVLQVEPKNLSNHLDLAKILYRRKNPDEAVATLRDLLSHVPAGAQRGLAEVHFVLGVVLHETHQLEAATEHLVKATSLRSEHAESWAHLGGVYVKLGEFEKAFTAFSRQLERNQDSANAYAHLGHVSLQLIKYDDALEYYRRAAELRPGEPEHQFDIGNTLNRMGEFFQAEQALRKCLERKPDHIKARSTMASALESQGDYESALNEYKALLNYEVTPLEHSNYLYALHFEYPQDPVSQLHAHRDYEQRQQIDDAKIRVPFEAKRSRAGSGTRPLRIGYVSPDFRRHSVAYFLEPFLDHHDRKKFEPYCYHVGWVRDAVTDRFKQKSNWRFAAPLTDEQLAERIRKDEIDILIDLAGHTGHNRSRVFTLRLSPVQISYLGYSGTTGLSTMDYLLTDEFANPAEEAHHCAEELLHFPETYFCYRPPASAPELADPPCLKDASISFGCFNNRRKIGAVVEDAWVAILNAVPHSRLVVKDLVYRNERIKEETLRRFAEKGIDRSRLVILDYVESTVEHLDLYSQIDIALDTFPYNGATTTCEALWMGVPVISLAGNTHVGRMGRSILTTLGLSEFVARNQSDYQAKAVELSKDAERIMELRSTMRARMRESALMDEVGQCRAMEAIFDELKIKHDL